MPTTHINIYSGYHIEIQFKDGYLTCWPQRLSWEERVIRLHALLHSKIFSYYHAFLCVCDTQIKENLLPQNL